jgi:asparagine N-glycosylation enzyme membrane subunit Stt3
MGPFVAISMTYVVTLMLVLLGVIGISTPSQIFFLFFVPAAGLLALFWLFSYFEKQEEGDEINIVDHSGDPKPSERPPPSKPAHQH